MMVCSTRAPPRLRSRTLTSWLDVTAADIYTVHNIFPFLRKEILERMGTASRHGLTRHYASPPIVSIEYEMDLRGCRRDIVMGA